MKTPKLALYGKTLFGEPYKPPATNTLSEKFIIPPFSVLDARQGYWQERKRAWLALGIQSELGRGDDSGAGAKMALHDSTGFASPLSRKRTVYDKNRLSPGGSPRPAMDYSNKARGDGRGKELIPNGMGMTSKKRYDRRERE